MSKPRSRFYGVIPLFTISPAALDVRIAAITLLKSVAAGVVLGGLLSVAVVFYVLSPADRQRLAAEISSLAHDLPLVAVSLVTERLSYRRGASEARRDVADGVLRFRVAGLRDPSLDAAWEAELSDYGIEIVSFAGCVVDPDVSGRMDGYNAVMEEVIETRFGKRALDGTSEGARVASRQ